MTHKIPYLHTIVISYVWSLHGENQNPSFMISWWNHIFANFYPLCYWFLHLLFVKSISSSVLGLLGYNQHKLQAREQQNTLIFIARLWHLQGKLRKYIYALVRPLGRNNFFTVFHHSWVGRTCRKCEQNLQAFKIWTILAELHVCLDSWHDVYNANFIVNKLLFISLNRWT